MKFDISKLNGLLKEVAVRIDSSNDKNGVIENREISLFLRESEYLCKADRITPQEYYSVLGPFRRENPNYVKRKADTSLYAPSDATAYYNKTIIPIERFPNQDLLIIENKSDEAKHREVVNNLCKSWNNACEAHITPEFVEKCYAVIRELNLIVEDEEWQEADSSRYSCREDLIVDKLLGMMASESGINPGQWNGNNAVGLLQMQQDRLDEIRQKNPRETSTGGKYSVKDLIEFSQLSAEEQLDYFVEGIKICKRDYSIIEGPITVEQAYQMNHFPKTGYSIEKFDKKNESIIEAMEKRGELPPY